MPFMVKDLIEDNPPLVTATANDPVKVVLKKMIDHDFSQLPIIDDEYRPKGLITAESILKAQLNFAVNLDQLQVQHARIKVDLFRDDSDLFELLNRLRDTYAVLIIDGDDRLIGIVTNYDTTEYFRRRAEDMMLVEDIESMLKDYILAGYRDDNGEINEEKLNKAVQRTADRREEKKFTSALKNYLQLQEVKVNRDNLNIVLNKHYKSDQFTRKFEDLTLSEYERLLLDKEQWSSLKSIFNIELEPIRNLLSRVRDTRNSLAHFRGEISREQREHLRFSADWLAQYENEINHVLEPIPENQKTFVPEPEIIEEEIVPESVTEIVAAEDEVNPSDSRYAPLAIWLENQPPTKNLVKPSFSKIEEIIGETLPDSAYKHRAWWANDPVSHVQSQQWLDVGWRVSSINMSEQVVRFSRILERQKAYIDFFSMLITDLSRKPGFEDINKSPHGGSWHIIENVSINGQTIASFAFSFGRGKIFRIEFYIDYSDQKFNKKLFDQLSKQRSPIERAVGYTLLWQRLDKRRASRIAIIYQNIQITSSSAELNQLCKESVTAMVKFRAGFLPYVLEIGQELMNHEGKGWFFRTG